MLGKLPLSIRSKRQPHDESGTKVHEDLFNGFFLGSAAAMIGATGGGSQKSHCLTSGHRGMNLIAMASTLLAMYKGQNGQSSSNSLLTYQPFQEHSSLLQLSEARSRRQLWALQLHKSKKCTFRSAFTNLHEQACSKRNTMESWTITPLYTWWPSL